MLDVGELWMAPQRNLLPVPEAERFRRFRFTSRTERAATEVMQRWRICLFLPPLLHHCDWKRERQRGERQVSLLPSPSRVHPRTPHPPAPDLREKREEVTANNRLSSTLPQTFLLCSWLTWERRWQDAHGWRHRKHTRVHEMHSYTPRYTHTVFNWKTFICFPKITEFKPQQL